MQDPFSQEVQFGISNMDRVALGIFVITPQQLPKSVRASALAFECLGYYNAVEHLMLRFLKHANMPKPSGASSHRDAINGFDTLCKQVDCSMSDELKGVVVELMGFRHVATKIYSFMLDLERLDALAMTIQANHQSLRQHFMELLQKTSSTG